MIRLFSSLLLVAAFFGSSGQAQATVCSDPQNSLPIDTAPISVDYVMTVDNESPNGGIFTAEVTYEGTGWVALAFSPSGGMVGSLAVIGLPGDQAGAGVWKFDLGGYSEAEVSSSNQQTLMDTSCMQNETHTIMKFSKYLKEEGETVMIDPSGTNSLLVAAGASNSLGYHAHRVSLGGLSLDVCKEEMAQNNGDTICVDGYIMDRFCIDRGTLLDNPNTETLVNPERHSVHCLVDVGVCRNSPFHILEDLGNGYGEGWSVTDNDPLIELARAVGSCSTCDGDGNQRSGFQAAVRGIVVDADNKVLQIEEVAETGTDLCSNRPEPQPTDPQVPPPRDDPVLTSAPTDSRTQAPIVTSAPTTGVDTTPEVVNCSEYQEYLEVEGVPITLEYVVNVDEDSPTGGLFSARVTYEGQGYIAMGLSPEGRMIGSLGVIGLPDEGQVQKYNLGGYSEDAVTLADQQTLVNATVMQNNTHTVMSFSRHLNQEEEIAINPSGTNFILVAAGASNTLGFHLYRASLGLAFQPCVEGSIASDVMSNPAITTVEIDTKQSLFKAHGAIAALAWGILAPMAIANSMLRHLIPGQGVWFQLHRGLNMLVLLLTMVSFALVVKAINDTSNGQPRHFQPRDGALGKHHTIGLVVFIMVILQSIGGIMRPHLPEKGDKPSVIRVMWEYGHKGSGVVLLAMAWYQCHSGLVLYAQRFVQEQDYTFVFWCTAGTIAAIGISGRIHGAMTAEPVADTSDKDVPASTNNGPSESDSHNEAEFPELEILSNATSMDV